MSCICQYIIGSSTMLNGEQPIGFSLPNPHEAAVANEGPCDTSNEPVTDDTKIAGCVSELVDCRAENWLLKKKLEEHEVTIQNLEQLMTTIVNKQHKVLSEMFQLRKRNHELQTECNLQREYHTMERNALIKELYNLKTFNNEHTYVLPKKSGEENEPNISVEDQPEMGSDVEKGNYAYDSEEDDNESKHDNEDEDSYEDGEDDERSAGSSAGSTASSSHNSSMYSTFSESGESEESEDELEGSEQLDENYGTRSESESD